MRHKHTIATTIILLILSFMAGYTLYRPNNSGTGAPPFGEPESEVPSTDPLEYIRHWVRPDTPPKVALQVGHLENQNLPEELEKLRGNSGATGAQITEVEINQRIAQQIKPLLEARGITVDILPATVPPAYWADIFIAIHADGSTDPNISGYKFAKPWRDFTNQADDLLQRLDESYANATGFRKDPNITRNMRGYYAFAWWRYDHAIHPMTTAIIAETGFITNPQNETFLIQNTPLVAEAIAQAIIQHLQAVNLID